MYVCDAVIGNVMGDMMGVTVDVLGVMGDVTDVMGDMTRVMVCVMGVADIYSRNNSSPLPSVNIAVMIVATSLLQYNRDNYRIILENVDG